MRINKRITNKQKWLYSAVLSIITQVIFILAIHISERLTFGEAIASFFLLMIIGFVPICLIYRLIYAIATRMKRPDLRDLALSDLPLEIKNYYNIIELVKAHGQSSSGNTNALESSYEFIDKDEKLYFICATGASINEIKGASLIDESGVVFISQRRVAFIRKTGKVFDFPFVDIHSVGDFKDSAPQIMTFSTTSLHISYPIAHMGPALASLRKRIISAIEAAQNQAIAQTISVIECPGCAATVLVRHGETNRCEYCDRHVDGDINV